MTKQSLGIKWFKEYSKTPMHRSGTMIPSTQKIDKGYCTLYHFNQLDSEAVTASGCSRGLGAFSVRSNVLMIDIDRDTPSEANKALSEALIEVRKLNAPTKVWFSGKKGYHIGIRIEEMIGKDVPYSQHEFVKQLQIPYDESLYQHARLLSNEGRIHPDTGKPKKLIDSFNLDKPRLFIPMVKDTSTKKEEVETWSDVDELHIGLARLMISIENGLPEGARHTTFWSISSQLHRAGLQENTILDLMINLNNTLRNPKDEQEVERAVRQAFI